MAVNRNTYGLPDSTLQLIAGSPELSIPSMQQGSAAQFATPDVRRSDLISALRGIPGAANPGFTRYANAANGSALAPGARKPLNVISPARLTMAKYIAPEVVLPGAETPYVPPDRPFVPDLIYPDIINSDPIVPDPEVPEPPEVPEGTPLVLDPVVDPVVDPEDDPVDPDPDYFEPTELDPFVLDPLIYPQDPVKERDGTVIIEPVDPNEEFPQDDGTTDDILELINYLNSSLGGGSGGGKPQVDDLSWGELEF